MALVPLDVSLVGRVLNQDIFSRSGLLLLSRGTVLSSSEIFKMLRQKIMYVDVEDEKETSTQQDDPNKELSKHLQNFYIEKEVSAAYVTVLDNARQLFDEIREDYIPPINQFSGPFLPLVDQILNQSGIFRAIYVLDGSEGYTYRHSINVGILSSLIAKLLRLSKEEIILIGQAGLLHDVGKMLVPKEILMKPGKLTEEEFEQMKLHTVHGYNLLSKMEGGSEIFAEIALSHHERLDGSGYPEKQVQKGLSYYTQIVMVADVFDAICSDRVYKRRTSPFEAANLLWNEACLGKINAEIATRFIHFIATLYTGSRAVLNSGDEVEVVLIYQDEPMRPLVRRHDEYLDLRHHRGLAIERMIG